MMAQQDKINFREVNDGLEEVIQSKEDCPSTPWELEAGGYDRETSSS